MKVEYITGETERGVQHSYSTFKIDELSEEHHHYGKIWVYGDRKLRDKIIKLLNKGDK